MKLTHPMSIQTWPLDKSNLTVRFIKCPRLNEFNFFKKVLINMHRLTLPSPHYKKLVKKGIVEKV